MKLRLSESSTEMSGAVILALLSNLQAAEFEPLNKKWGLEDIKPDKWYSSNQYQHFLHDLSQQPNLMFNLVAIGMKIAETALMPPALEEAPFTQIIEGWDQHYQANFRNGNAGRKITVKVDDKHYKIVHDNTLAPDDVELGCSTDLQDAFYHPAPGLPSGMMKMYSA
jgi:hypothetical protein